MRLVLAVAVSMLLVMTSACSWVELTDAGERVRVLALDEVDKCRLLGKTTASVTDKLVGVRRHADQIQEELTIVARNAAINLNGDTIVPVGEEQDGKQVFQVYRCVPE